jgi:hypothetical protein
MPFNTAQKPTRGYKAPQDTGGRRETWDSSDDDSWTNAPSNGQSLQAACPLGTQPDQSQDDDPLDPRVAEVARTKGENADLRRQLAECESKAGKAEEKAAAYLKFVRQALSDYPELGRYVTDDLLEDKQVLCIQLQKEGKRALDRAPQELRAEIEKNEIRGFCIFCHEPVWFARIDPNGQRGKRQKTNKEFDYFHTKCHPAHALHCFECNEPLTGYLHSDYGEGPEGFYHIGGCPKAKSARD